VEIFRGNARDPRFVQWLEKINGKNNIIVIAGNDIPCYKAREIFKKNFPVYYPWMLDSFKEMLIHLISCDDQRCKYILEKLRANAS